MKTEKLKEILAQHALWLYSDKKEGERAYLAGADLSGADLGGVDLRGAYLAGADLSGADLGGVDLRGANLVRVDLRGADLFGANLVGVDLAGANLVRVDFRNADLGGVDLRGANLVRANLFGVDLSGAKLDYQIQDGLLEEIANRVMEDKSRLKMESWHSYCGTAHCIAGWACALSPVAAKLEKEVGTHIAALLTLGEEAAENFFLDNTDALVYLKSIIQPV